MLGMKLKFRSGSLIYYIITAGASILKMPFFMMGTTMNQMEMSNEIPWLSKKTGNGKYQRYRIVNDYCELELTQGKTTIIDIDEMEKVLQHKWYADVTNDGYWRARGYMNGKNVLLHRFILDTCNRREQIDHIKPRYFGDELDNRRQNIRKVNRETNMNNIKMLVTNKTGVNGVKHYELVKRYTAQWQENKKRRSKSFGYGEKSNRTQEEAFQLACAFRAARDAETGCMNGIRRKSGDYEHLTGYEDLEKEEFTRLLESNLQNSTEAWNNESARSSFTEEAT